MQLARCSIVKVFWACSMVLFVAVYTIAQNSVTRTVIKDGKDVQYQFVLYETGVASWYGKEFHGRKTANGEIFNKNSLTAAHRTLPFGTWVLVKNLGNGKEVLVRINDRGPFAKGRIIDLSEAGARMLGMIQTGTAQVALYIMQAPSAGLLTLGSVPALSPSGQNSTSAAREHAVKHYKVQVGSYAQEHNALREQVRLKEQGLSAMIEKTSFDGRELYRIVIFTTELDLPALLKKLAELGIQQPLVIPWE